MTADPEGKIIEDRVQTFCRAKGGETIYPSDVARALSIQWRKANEAMESLRAKGKLKYACNLPTTDV